MYKIQAKVKNGGDWFDIDLSPFDTYAEAEYWLEHHQFNEVNKIYDYQIVPIE